MVQFPTRPIYPNMQDLYGPHTKAVVWLLEGSCGNLRAVVIRTSLRGTSCDDYGRAGREHRRTSQQKSSENCLSKHWLGAGVNVQAYMITFKYMPSSLLEVYLRYMILPGPHKHVKRWPFGALFGGF